MPAGYSGTPLPRKLAIRSGDVVAVFGGPGHAAHLLADTWSGLRLVAQGAAEGLSGERYRGLYRKGFAVASNTTATMRLGGRSSVFVGMQPSSSTRRR
jgi:hypothetical protein